MQVASNPRLIVDRSHLGRRASGIERITEELFSDAALEPLPVEGFASGGRGRLAMAAAQMARAPLAMATRPRTLWAFPGFPPSPLTTLFRERTVMYVHDLFLITRRADLNRAAKIYMAAPFRYAIGRLRYFLVNSATTAATLRPFVRPDAEIRPYRPRVRNVFGLSAERRRPPAHEAPIVLGAIGTIEPRKNFRAAAAIAGELGRRLGRAVQLHIIGRAGWGEDAAVLAKEPHVVLHGFLADGEARTVMQGFDALLCPSHDEGLGLPLLEAQYAGLPVIASDKPVFREVLADSGHFIEPDDVRGAAERIEACLVRAAWRAEAGHAAARNIARWNTLADGDHADVVAFLDRRLAALRG